MSRSLAGLRSIRYSLSPPRTQRRVMIISSPRSTIFPSSSVLSRIRETSAVVIARRDAAPAKMTSSIFEPRTPFADVSPSTQRMASDIFDFPLPLGPTTIVAPSLKLSTVLSGNDLKPRSSSDLIFNFQTVRFFCFVARHMPRKALPQSNYAACAHDIKRADNRKFAHRAAMH